jgi:uncharacterized protein (TIGR03067 family)
MQRIICVLFVLASPQLLTAADDDAAKELKALEGKWKAVGLEMGGKPLPKETVAAFEFSYIISADGKASGRMGKSEYEAELSVDPKKSPKTIDNTHESGQYKGKMQYGIYKKNGDKWIVCMSPPGVAETDRPKSFDTKNSKNVVFTFERVKEDKKP